MVMVLGAIIAAVGTFLPFEKLVFFNDGAYVGFYQFKGIGSHTSAGLDVDDALQPGNAGKIILGVAVLSLVLGALVVARKGRLWVSIVAIVLSAIGLVMGLASLAAPASDQKDLNATADAGFSATGLVKMGATLSTVGTGVLLVAAILAIAVRRRQA